MEKNTNKPSIRFAEFTDAWEQRKLNEIVSYASSSLSAKDAADDGKWNLYDANHLIGKTNLFFVRYDYITIIKDGAGVGRVRLLPKNSAFIGTMGALLPLNSDLLFDYALLTKADLSRKFSGSTIPHIYFKDYGNETYRTPLLLEQQKIGSLFERLDSLITLHQRKCDQLGNIKKALLEKMFPSQNEYTPRIRFKCFTDAWEQRKLNEIVSYASSSLSAKDAADDGKWNLYDANHLIGKTNLFFVRYDYITIIKDGAGVGRVRLLPKNSAFIGTMGALLPLNSDLLFDYALLTKADLSRKFSGSTIPHIYFKDYGNETYRTPLLLEQQKIGSLFERLDSLITLHLRFEMHI